MGSFNLNYSYIRFIFRTWILFFLVVVVSLYSECQAFESDQWVSRQIPLRDSTAIINETTQSLLNSALLRWTEDDAALAVRDLPEAQKKLFSLVFSTVSGVLPTGHLELWLALTDQVDSQDVRTQSVYFGAPVSVVHLNSLFASCANIRLGGIRLGSDKVRHFFSLGAKYYKRVVFDGQTERQALAFGEETERTYFGFWVSGVYSNADLVANYEGYLFFKSLFEQTTNVAGLVVPPLITWDHGWPRFQRNFTWENHVSPLWDEALFPSYFQPALQLFMDGVLGLRFCFNYRLDPASFDMQPTQSQIENIIAQRYGNIRFIYNWQNRLDLLCGRGQERR